MRVEQSERRSMRQTWPNRARRRRAKRARGTAETENKQTVRWLTNNIFRNFYRQKRTTKSKNCLSNLLIGRKRLALFCYCPGCSCGLIQPRVSFENKERTGGWVWGCEYLRH